MRKFDIYSPNFQFLLPDGNAQYQTATGGTLCIFFGLIVLIYSLSTGIKLVNREGYSLVELTNENVYRDSDFSFSYDDGFAVAAAITYGNTTLNTLQEDPEIGQMKFVIKYWQNSTQGVEFRELKLRNCESKDIAMKESVDRNEYGFYTFDPDTEGNVIHVKDQLKCIDEPFEIKGHYDSFTAANLMVVYEVCDPSKRKCKSPDEIQKALQYSYILLVENHMHYKH